MFVQYITYIYMYCCLFLQKSTIENVLPLALFILKIENGHLISLFISVHTALPHSFSCYYPIV